MTRNKLIELMERTWGEEEECVDALINFIGDLDLIADIITNDRSFNRYTFCGDWNELAQEILNDECFEDEMFEDDPVLEFLEKNINDEQAVKEFLIKQNWCVDTINNVAIGFDNDVDIIRHEV